MTKYEAIQRIYGDNPPFIYDGALPQPILDRIANEAAHNLPEDIRNDYRSKVYNTILSGTVYAYDRKGHGAGLLPITKEARLEILLSSCANMVYVPILEETEPEQW